MCIRDSNGIRQRHRAFQLYDNLRFHASENEQVMFYSKRTPDGLSQVLVAVSFDPYNAQDSVLYVPLEELGIQPDETYQVHELISDTRGLWQGPTAQVRLTPEQPAAIWAIYRFRRSEQAFDYYE